eukprot:367833-Amphidinium_carterae.1
MKQLNRGKPPPPSVTAQSSSLPPARGCVSSSGDSSESSHFRYRSQWPFVEGRLAGLHIIKLSAVWQPSSEVTECPPSTKG